MNHCTATPYSPLLGCCSRGEVRVHMSVGLAATPPYKSIIYNALYALSLARGGAMRRGCWASHAEGALSAHGGHEYARISLSHADAAEKRRSALATARACLRDVCIRRSRPAASLCDAANSAKVCGFCVPQNASREKTV